MTASFGVAMLEADAPGPESVMRRADVALYAAKGSRVVIEWYAASADRWLEPIGDAPSTIVAKNP